MDVYAVIYISFFSVIISIAPLVPLPHKAFPHICDVRFVRSFSNE